jgi:hypothetical protein
MADKTDDIMIKVGEYSIIIKKNYTTTTESEPQIIDSVKVRKVLQTARRSTPLKKDRAALLEIQPKISAHKIVQKPTKSVRKSTTSKKSSIALDKVSSKSNIRTRRNTVAYRINYKEEELNDLKTPAPRTKRTRSEAVCFQEKPAENNTLSGGVESEDPNTSNNSIIEISPCSKPGKRASRAQTNESSDPVKVLKKSKENKVSKDLWDLFKKIPTNKKRNVLRKTCEAIVRSSPRRKTIV